MERDLLTIQEAARELELSVTGVHDRIRKGRLRGVQVSPRLWLVPREEVEHAKAAGRLKPGPKPKREHPPGDDSEQAPAAP